jgi:hypothetical protein
MSSWPIEYKKKKEKPKPANLKGVGVPRKVEMVFLFWCITFSSVYY